MRAAKRGSVGSCVTARSKQFQRALESTASAKQWHTPACIGFRAGALGNCAGMFAVASLLAAVLAGCGGSASSPKIAPLPENVASPPQAVPPPDSGQGEVHYYQAEPEEAAGTDQQYSVVKVYYATDRTSLDVSRWRQSLRGGWP